MGAFEGIGNIFGGFGKASEQVVEKKYGKDAG